MTEEKYKILPIKAIEIYRKSIIVKRYGIPNQNKGKKRTDIEGDTNTLRGEIRNLSDKSLSRLAFVAANTWVEFHTMATITYRGIPIDGQEVKKDLNRILQWLRRNYKGCEYLWFLEFQKRGAPHFHILLDIKFDPENIRKVRGANGEYWFTEWEKFKQLEIAWGKGFIRWETIREKEGALRYAVKYAMKPEQKSVPKEYRNVGRFWGASRGVNPQKLTEYDCSEDTLRRALEEWEYLPKEGQMIYPELYNATEKINIDVLEEREFSRVCVVCGVLYVEMEYCCNMATSMIY